MIDITITEFNIELDKVFYEEGSGKKRAYFASIRIAQTLDYKVTVFEPIHVGTPIAYGDALLELLLVLLRAGALAKEGVPKEFIDELTAVSKETRKSPGWNEVAVDLQGRSLPTIQVHTTISYFNSVPRISGLRSKT